tara:strand:- start:96 stop:248 length:153 start_codon:yes stop_codon:yes gene_type:complete
MYVTLSMGFSKTMTKVKSNLEGLRIGKTTTTIKDVAKTPSFEAFGNDVRS